MGETVDVVIPVDGDVAETLTTPASRAAAGALFSEYLRKNERVFRIAAAIAELKREAQSNGLTDEIVDEEIAAWKAEQSARRH